MYYFSVSAADISYLLVSQHQQQVVQAVERAKQVTMDELNAIIGVGVLYTLTDTRTNTLLSQRSRQDFLLCSGQLNSIKCIYSIKDE